MSDGFSENNFDIYFMENYDLGTTIYIILPTINVSRSYPQFLLANIFDRYIIYTCDTKVLHYKKFL